jgi:predicted DNA-binding antitoxin AbrB/MazE fold protein
MNQIEAIFQDGVFKPLGHVVLPDQQRVRLDFCTVEEPDARIWLDEVQRLQRRILDADRVFPDSTPDIAADRTR